MDFGPIVHVVWQMATMTLECHWPGAIINDYPIAIGSATMTVLVGMPSATRWFSPASATVSPVDTEATASASAEIP